MRKSCVVIAVLILTGAPLAVTARDGAGRGREGAGQPIA